MLKTTYSGSLSPHIRMKRHHFFVILHIDYNMVMTPYPTIAIIGAGQIGSRHLQGAARCSTPLDIYVVDPSQQSLETAKERFDQVAPPDCHHLLHTVENASLLPKHIDIAVIATDSMHRFEALKSLTGHCSVDTVILEKFLFTKLEEYGEAASLLESKGITAYVNCPRRVWPAYEKIATLIDTSQPLAMRKPGQDWGLCCNAIHFIDVFLWLAAQDLYSVSTEMIRPEVIPSKRNGYIELFGTLNITTPRGDTLSLTSLPDDMPAEVVIRQEGLLLHFDEGAGNISYRLTRNGETREESLNIHTPFQSELTGEIIEKILAGLDPGLCSYAESSSAHRELFVPLLDFVNNMSGTHSDCLPIT